MAPRQPSKEEFMVAYILARAKTAANLNGNAGAEEALAAWKVIRRECPR